MDVDKNIPGWMDGWIARYIDLLLAFLLYVNLNLTLSTNYDLQCILYKIRINSNFLFLNAL